MWYPLKFHEVLRDYSFGARWIPELLGKPWLPREGVIAETWEICDHGKDISIVRNGELTGKSLHELIKQHGADLLGTQVMEMTKGRFPIIAKFLDATNELSPQVHPDDKKAPKNKVEKTGKTEAWYVLAARPGAVVHCGVKPSVTKSELRAIMRAGDPYDALMPWPVEAGDMVFVPAGAVHASKGGIIIYEIMQNCDTTYCFPAESNSRRSIEIERGRRKFLDAVHFEKDPTYRTVPVTTSSAGCVRTFVLACRYFAVERLDITKPWNGMLDGRRFELFSCIEGGGKVHCEGGEEVFGKGESFFLPAKAGKYAIEPQSETALIKAYLPDLKQDIVTPLKEAGFSNKEIASLGGKGSFNDLAGLV